jgi:hyperosmotically inducible protein
MKRAQLFILIFMTAVFPVIAANQTAPAKLSLTDEEITTAVKQHFNHDQKLSGAGIDVETREGVVTLSGRVLGRTEAERAVTIAKRVPGVKSVENKLEADTYITNEDVENRRDEEQNALKEQQEQNEPDRSTGDIVDDAVITSSIKLKLAKDDVVSAFNIDVDTDHGEVTLTGTVKRELEAKRAISIAESVEGVKKVKSVLTIKPE